MDELLTYSPAYSTSDVLSTVISWELISHQTSLFLGSTYGALIGSWQLRIQNRDWFCPASSQACSPSFAPSLSNIPYTNTFFRLVIPASSPYVRHHSTIRHGALCTVWVIVRYAIVGYNTFYRITYLSQYPTTYTPWETQPPPVGNT